MSFKDHLDKRVAIKQEVTTEDGQGGFTETLSTLYKRVPCCFESLIHEKQKLERDQQATFPDYYVYMVSRPGIKEGQLLFFEGRRFRIDLVEDWRERHSYVQLHITEERRNE